MPDTEAKSPPSNLARYLRPDRFDTEPSSTSADLKWEHWRKSFDSFLQIEAASATDETRLLLLINHVAPTIYNIIRDCTRYSDAITRLNTTFEKRRNVILARHLLVTRKQQPGETIAEYSRALATLAHDCDYKQVTADEHQTQSIRGALISGISNQRIRERLLENSDKSLEETLKLALSLETAENSCQTIQAPTNHMVTSLNAVVDDSQVPHNAAAANTNRPRRRCFFCGGNLHQRSGCPARNAECKLCSRKGHYASVCRSSGKPRHNAAMIAEDEPQGTATTSSYPEEACAAAPSSLRKATTPITINNHKVDALIDTGSSISFIDRELAQTMKLKTRTCYQTITLASASNVSHVNGVCHATIRINEHTYKQQPLFIINNLCADVIVGHDILKTHSCLELQFGGDKEALRICNVLQASVPPASVFTNLSSSIKPIAIPSRRHSEEDQQFIAKEISSLLENKIIEPSVSPWRAQVLIAGGSNHRKRMVIDYSRTINRYTELDAYPIPNIDSVVTRVAKYNYFSQIDLKSAYHQVPIPKNEKIYTAFEACGNLYQFTRIPFGVTNGVAAFQRTLHYVINTEKLKGTYAYLDDVTVCGKDKAEHDVNLHNFMEAAKKYNLTLNLNKCVFETDSINLLGYSIHGNSIKPDKTRLEPLVNLPVPSDPASLKRTLGLFAHYSKWIYNFSAKVKPLTESKLPLSPEAIECFSKLKTEIIESALASIDNKEIFTVETDASDYAIAATLSQKGRPVAFFTRMLNESERRQPSIEKEACAIVDALRKWRHYLLGRHFILVTDQRSVSFMFDQSHASKIKNEKIERWRLELSCFKYDIRYRPGKENLAADALSRVCAVVNESSISKLIQLHKSLCHPGIARMVHWVRSKNLPYSVEEVKRMTAACPTCAEIKPKYAKNEGLLIKATAPFERLNIDFKGPLPSKTNNKYILTIIDEYSRFPFAFACKDMTSETVIKCFQELFLLFGTPAYIHSDRGSSFLSEEMKSFLTRLGIASSRTSPYNPQGNGLVERLNGTLWKTIQLHLRSNNLDGDDWEKALPTALHAIRSLLSTGINTTPHERMFKHPRRSCNGASMPSWLMTPGPVYMKRMVKKSKYEPNVEEVELLQSNPDYSYVRLPDGRETTVSNRRLAPLPRAEDEDEYLTAEDGDEYLTADEHEIQQIPQSEDDTSPNEDPPGVQQAENVEEIRRSQRERRAPAYLQDYVSFADRG